MAVYDGNSSPTAISLQFYTISDKSNIRDILGTAMKNQTDFRRQLDAVSNYMLKFKVPSVVQTRVKTWMHYTWSQQNSFNEDKVLSFLPLKMRTDLALQIHYPTLSKVKLFQDCDNGLLKELVVKLRPIIYLPGDYICRKDDIGREMYIVQSGYVQVLGGKDGKSCLVELGEGSVFGEIALLGVTGMNRRTADVVSKGFSSLFTLSKEDLEESLKNYPDAKRILNAKARKLMKENDERSAKEDKAKVAHGEVLFKEKSNKRDPALLNMVMKMLPAHSMTQLYLKHGSRVGSVSLQGASSETHSRMVDPDRNSFTASRASRYSYPTPSTLLPSKPYSKESSVVFTEPASARVPTPSRRSSLATTVFDRRDIPELQFSMEEEEEARGEELSGWTDTGETEQDDVDLSPNIRIRTGQDQTPGITPRAAGQAQVPGISLRTAGQTGGHQQDLDNMADDEDIVIQGNNH